MSLIGKTSTRKTVGRTALWIVAILILCAVFVTVWVGVRGALAAQHLLSLQREATSAGAELLTSPTQAKSLVEKLSRDASAASGLTSDPIWAFAELTPWAGPQLTAFRQITTAADTLIAGAVTPLVDAMQTASLDSLKPDNGRIEATALAPLAEPAAQAAQASSQAANEIHEIDRTPLVGILARGVEDLDSVFSRTAAGIDAISKAAQLLPAMLGNDGPQEYLILVQNNAEWRSLGGIAGTTILLRTDQGAISLEATESGTALSRAIKAPLFDLPGDIQALYGTKPARYFQNLTQIPDFTIDGPLAQQMYEIVTGVRVNGVIAIDPVVLSYLLQATGSVRLEDGSKLSSDNAVDLLLNGVYKKYPEPSDQDAFFAASTGAVFQAFLGGTASTPKLLSALSRATEERRIKIWSSDPDQQAILLDSSLSGVLPTSSPDTATFGVYLNESGGSKMSYYVSPTVTLSWGACKTTSPSSASEITLAIELTSDAPLDAATSLPSYMTANGAFGVAPGNAATVSNVFIPSDWEVVSAESSTGIGFSRSQFSGQQVLTFESNLAPQTSESAKMVLRSVSSSATSAEVVTTPTADASRPTVLSADCKPASTAALR
ncbi:DUF4012 domain-containing protein [Microbacterium sp. JC 701]|uniref:DUF4012 domain-containing protein n=1 Tax=Microbacterium sp. JC 701 TaxID=2897389 RepID=UPI001E40EEE2|nr:DUF4012 domain-containing protein [Microbacterium sp. JC 701]MCD2170219.1 DUF4012 domain-containing protein [Microbacterium sp. JC 701]